jgi:hypothetical protein
MDAMKRARRGFAVLGQLGAAIRCLVDAHVPLRGTRRALTDVSAEASNGAGPIRTPARSTTRDRRQRHVRSDRLGPYLTLS